MALVSEPEWVQHVQRHVAHYPGSYTHQQSLPPSEILSIPHRPQDYTDTSKNGNGIPKQFPYVHLLLACGRLSPLNTRNAN